MLIERSEALKLLLLLTENYSDESLLAGSVAVLVKNVQALNMGLEFRKVNDPEARQIKSVPLMLDCIFIL